MNRPCTGDFSTEVTEDAPRDKKFKRDCPGARKQVETARTLYVDDILYDIKYVFTREVCGGTRGDIGRNAEAASAIFSSYYSHNGETIKSNGALIDSLPARNICGGNIAGITREMYVRNTGVTSSRKA